MKILQDSYDEIDEFNKKKINQIIELNQDKEEVQHKLLQYQDKMKTLFDRKARERYFRQGDMVLIWDARREHNGKHAKFDNFWLASFKIAEVKGNGNFIIQNMEGKFFSLTINGQYLKHYIQ